MNNKIKLNEKEVNVLSNFFYQVNNGGLEQYIGNGYASEEASELLEVLDKCELNKTSQSLQGNYAYQDGTCDFCEWGCQEGCEDETDEYDDPIEDCYCECDCYNYEATHQFDELEDDNEYTVPCDWDDSKFYNGEDSVMIEAIIKYNEGFVSKSGSIILDAILKEA